MILNGHFALNSVLRRYVWSSEAWLSKLGYTLKLLVNVVGKLYTEKNNCGIARFPCNSTAFLFYERYRSLHGKVLFCIFKRKFYVRYATLRQNRSLPANLQLLEYRTAEMIILT